jgi:hypothetical protein
MLSLTSSAYPADELDAIDADETGKLPVGVQDDLTMHQHRFVDAITELGKQPRRVDHFRAAGGGARQ